MAWDPINETELNPGYAVLKHVRQVWNCLKWLYGTIGTLAGGSIQNGSFEIDSESNGVPDNWVWSAYPGGSIGLDTSTPAHGAHSVQIVHPGGSGNGGGVLYSDYNECSPQMAVYLGFIHWASAAGMRNLVQIYFYDKAKVYLSATSLYDSTTNPTSPVYFVSGFTPPASARYYKIVLIGGYTDTNVAGSAYFDAVKEAQFANMMQPYSGSGFTYAERSMLIYPDYHDIGGPITIFVPRSGMIVCISFTAEAWPDPYQTDAVRFRSSTGDYSNEVTFTYGGSQTGTFTIYTGSFNGGSVTLYPQMRNIDGGYGDGHTRKTSGDYTVSVLATNFIP